MTEVVINKTPLSIFDLSKWAIDWLLENGYEETFKKYEEDELNRDDPGLVAVVEHFGEDAGKHSCHPKVVSVPDDADWHISSNKQREVIVEEHRTWK